MSDAAERLENAAKECTELLQTSEETIEYYRNRLQAKLDRNHELANLLRAAERDRDFYKRKVKPAEDLQERFERQKVTINRLQQEKVALERRVETQFNSIQDLQVESLDKNAEIARLTRELEETKRTSHEWAMLAQRYYVGEYKEQGENTSVIDTSNRDEGTKSLARYFAYDHLKGRLRDISMASTVLAQQMIDELPDGPELSAGLRKLLEAKDCFVRAALDIKDE